MAVPTHISSTGGEGGSISKDSNFYATTLANDIAIQQCSLITGTVTATPPADWNILSDVSFGTAQRKITIWKRCGANEASPQWTSITAGARFFQSTIIRGCVTTGNPYDSSWSDGSIASTTAVSLDLGVTSYSDILYLVQIVNFSAGTVTTWTDANLSSVTERYDLAAGGMSPKAITGGLAIAGDGGTLTGTLSVAGNQIWTIVPLLSTTSVISGANNGSFFPFFFP